MKKIVSAAFVLLLLGACSGTGDRRHDMPTNTTEAPTSDPMTNEGPLDTSTSNAVKDSSTTATELDTNVTRQ
jgi:PBP1b-binding outer membrane lipoprotein LpoB